MLLFTFFFASPVKAEDKNEEEEEEATVKPKEEATVKPRVIKNKSFEDLYMSFTPLQQQALHALFALSPAERQKAIAFCATPPQSFRSSTSGRTSASSRFSSSVSDGGDDVHSVASEDSVRIHH